MERWWSDMTIDEAIAHARENYNDIINTTYNKCQYEHLSCEGCATPTCKEIADENLQIAEWLEELKSYRAHIFSGDMTRTMLKEQYNKAIDDFAKLVEIWCWKHEQYNQDDLNTLMDIAEQLKAGVKNGTSM